MSGEDLLPRMAEALRHMPCGCQYERNAAGVPVWHPHPDGGIERKQIKECAKCALLKEFDAL